MHWFFSSAFSGKSIQIMCESGINVSLLFTVYLHLKTGTYESLTIKGQDFVEGLNRLCHDKAVIIEGTGIISPVTENTCCCSRMEPPS